MAIPRPYIGIFYGSTDGHTAAVAHRLKAKLDAHPAMSGGEPVKLHDIADYYLEEMLEYDCIIAGISTWDTGQFQHDWERVLEEFDALDLSGKQVAIFGLGDQVGYPDTFVDAVFFVAEKVRSAGATLVGAWPTGEYSFAASWAVENDHFLGLILDEHNQPELTEPRLDAWIAQLMEQFQVVHA